MRNVQSRRFVSVIDIEFFSFIQFELRLHCISISDRESAEFSWLTLGPNCLSWYSAHLSWLDTTWQGGDFSWHTSTHFIIICIWSNHTKCKFLISALSNDWTSGHPAPPPPPPRPPRLSSPPGLLLRALPRSILHRSRPEETCASTPFGLDLKVHHRGTKTQNFPGSNFPPAKTFMTTPKSAQLALTT